MNILRNLTTEKITAVVLALTLSGCTTIFQKEPINEGDEIDVNSISRPLDIERPVDTAPLIANYLSAMMAEHEGTSGDAAEYYAMAEKADPDNHLLREKNFALQLTVGNMEEALRLAKSLESFNDSLPFTFLLLAVDSIRNNDINSAKAYIERAQQTSSKILHFQIIKSYLAMAEEQDINEVLQELENFDTHSMLSPHRYYHTGRMLERVSDNKGAVEAYKEAYKLDKTAILPVVALWNLYNEQGDFIGSKSLYKDFLEKNVGNTLLINSFDYFRDNPKILKNAQYNLQDDIAEVMFGFSTLMVSQGMVTAGKQLLNITTMIKPNYIFSKFYYGVIAEKVGDKEAAKNHYGSIKEGEYGWLVSRLRIADLLFRSGNPKTSIAMLEALSDKVGGSELVSSSLSQLYYNASLFDKAIAHYTDLLHKKAGNITRQDAWIYFALGASLERTHRYEDAKLAIEASLKLIPENPTALNYLGYMLIEQGKEIRLGLTYISKALVLRPRDGAILDSMGWAWYKLEEYEKAVLFLEKAVEFLPDDATINAHVGDVYHKLERFQEARVQWRRALIIGFDDKKEEARTRDNLDALQHLR